MQSRQPREAQGLGSKPLFPTARAFIVQFSRDTDIGGEGNWQGRVEHVVSGRSSRFSTARDLFEFMRRVSGHAEV